MTTLAEYLQAWLIDHNMKPKNLADFTSVSHVTIGSYLRGEGRASADVLVKIAKFTGDPPEYLFRLAGILPESEDDPEYETKEIKRILARLPADRREEAIRWLQAYARMVDDEARRTALAAKPRKLAAQ